MNRIRQQTNSTEYRPNVLEFSIFNVYLLLNQDEQILIDDFSRNTSTEFQFQGELKNFFHQAFRYSPIF